MIESYTTYRVTPYYLHSTIKSTRDYPATIRCELDGTNALSVPLVRMNTTFLSDIPNF